MAKIDVQVFGGRQPKVSARLLQNHQAQAAENVDTRTGKLLALLAAQQTTDHSSSVPETLWKMASSLIIFPDGEKNSVVDSPVDDTKSRIYWTDGVQPKQSNTDLWGEATWYYTLGVKAPSSAPTVTVDGSAGDDVQDYVSYVYTMVTTFGEESAPSPATSIATVMSGQHVDLSNLNTPTGSYNNYAYKRIYRLSSGTQGAEYQYLAQIAYGTTTYADDSGSDTLNEVETDTLPTDGWVTPPADLIYLTQAHNGMMCGAAGKELYICEANYPYAWPTDNVRVFDTDIQGIGCANQYIVVLTKKFCYVLKGQTPLSLSKVKMGNPQSCESARGVVSTDKGVLYPSPDGLCLCDGSTVEVVTKNWISKTDWQALNPDKLIGVWFDNKYYGFFYDTNDGIIYDLDTGEFVTITYASPIDKIKDAYADLETENLYILCTNTAGDNGYTYEIEGSSSYLTYTWDSKIFVDQHCYNCAKIEGNFGESNVTFKWYEGGSLKQTKTVSASTGMFRLPDSGFNTEKYFQISGSLEIYRVQIATSPKEID